MHPTVEALPTQPSCGHVMFTLVATDFSTWPATEVYECDTCRKRHRTPWE